jgi:hypothetical protein
MNRTTMWTTITLALVLAWANAAGALDPAPKCQAGKNKEAGKYAACRQKAEAKAITSGDPADYTKCDAKFFAKWARLEEKAGTGVCPDGIADPNSLTDFITDNCDAVATALATGDLPDCGDNAINVAGEQCDGTDLGGESCVSLGFDSGTLACASCAFDTSGCACPLPAQPLKTGQTTSNGTGSDGDLEMGVARSFTDNGNGTITDNVTGLTWEKKEDLDGTPVNCPDAATCPNPHDADNRYTWSATSPNFDGTVVSVFLTQLNTVPCFADYCDWRLPNANELETLRNLEVFGPATYTAFNQGCTSSCNLTDVNTCSCTVSSNYWSASAFRGNPAYAWNVYFFYGDLNYDGKTGYNYARAVRGGS